MKRITFFSAVFIFLTSTIHAQSLPASASSVSCIESVCGKSNPFAHPFEGNPGLLKATETKLKDELLLEKPIKQYMGRLMNNTLILDQAYSYLLSQPGNYEITPKGKAVLSTFSYLEKISELTPALVQNSTGYAFDREALEKILPTANSAEITAIMSLAAMFNASIRLGGLDKKPLEMFLKYLHPDKTTLEAQVIEAQRILVTQKKLWSYLIDLSFLGEKDLILIKASQGVVLNYLEKNHFKESIRSNASLEVILSEDVQQKFSSLPLDISRILENFKNKYEVSQQKALVKNPTTSKALLQENLKLCMSNLSYAYGALPSNDQLQNFQSMTNAVLAVAKNMVEEKSKSSLVSGDLGIEISYPETKTTMISGFLDGLKLLTEEYDNNLKLKKSFNLKDPKYLESYLILASVFSDSNVFENLQEYCDRGNIPKLDDAALTQHKILNLSWPTIQHPELGVSIFAHEVGHIVSRHYDTGTSKLCLLSEQNYNPKYMEEDFADLFSAEVLSRLNYSIGSTMLGNLSCALLPYDQNKGWLSGSLENADATDTHSSSFYRLLAFDKMTTGLTTQCQEHLKTLAKNPFDEYCKW